MESSVRRVALDDLQPPPAVGGKRRLQLVAGIAAIGEDVAQPGEGMADPPIDPRRGAVSAGLLLEKRIRILFLIETPLYICKEREMSYESANSNISLHVLCIGAWKYGSRSI